MVGFLLQVCERYYSLEEIHENNARCHHILLIRKGHFFCLYIRDHKPHSLFLSPQHLRASAWISSSNSPCKTAVLTSNCSISRFILATIPSNGCHLYDWCEDLIKINPFLLLKPFYYDSGLVSGLAAILPN